MRIAKITKAQRKYLGARRVVASVSGGKDSAALSLWLKEQEIEHDRVFLDTGWEHNSTYDYLRGELTRVVGAIHEVRGPRTMVELIRHKGMFPSRVKRYCTQELKVFPMQAYLNARMEAGEDLVNAVGIRRAESKARENMGEWEWQDGFDCEVWRPLVLWTEEQVIEMHHRHGLKPNPLYLLGAGRVGCFPCIFSSKREIRMMADIDPARVELLGRLKPKDRAHEFVFLLSKSADYFYDAEAIKEPATGQAPGNGKPYNRPERISGGLGEGSGERTGYASRNCRDVWALNPMPYKGAHFATFPETLAQRCILSGSSAAGACAACGAPRERQVERLRTLDGEPAPDLGAFRSTSKGEPTTAIGVGHHRVMTETRTAGWAPTCECGTTSTRPQLVLDPFMGSGTVGAVALREGRAFLGVELNPDYIALAQERMRVQTGLPFARGLA